MLSLLGAAGLAILERELVKMEPKLQQMAIEELQKLSDILLQYLGKKLNVNAIENKSKDDI
jgi:hypothetical protein